MPSRAQIARLLGGGGTTLAAYISSLIASAGGVGFWHPMRNTSGLISTNAAYQGGVLPVAITNPTFTGSPVTGWTALPIGDGVITPLSPGVRIEGKTTGGSSALLQTPVFTAGKTVDITLDVIANTGGAGARVKTGVGTNQFIIPAGTTGLVTGRLVADNVQLQITTNTGNDASHASIAANVVGDFDGVIAGTTTLGQTGLRGPNEAFLFDGSTSLITILNRASLQGLTAFTAWMLFKPSSAGEGNAGILFSKAGEYELKFNSSSRDLIATVNYSGTNATCTTNEVLSTTDWSDVALSIGADKVPHIWINGVEATYASTTTGIGTRVSNTNNLIIGNNSGATATIAGLLDEVLGLADDLNAGEIATLHNARAVA